jgi:molecular chaperone GrpE
VDNLERALVMPYEEGESTFKGLREGVEMTLKGLLDSLEKHGVVAVESLGQPFDPNLHQAVSQEDSEAYPDGTVSQELQKGYLLNERLLRPSMVIVSRKPDREETASPRNEEKEAVEDDAKGPPEETKGSKKIKVTVH